MATTTRAAASRTDDADLGTSIGKALALLEAFPDDVASVGVTELARRSGVAKATAFRLLAQLERRGYVERVGDGYALGRRLFELGNRVGPCRPRGLREVALPYLTEVYERTRRTVHLAVLDGSDVLYVEKLPVHGMRTPTRVGARVAASCTALGKAQLALGDGGAVEDLLRAGLRPRTPYSIAAPGAFTAELARIRADGVAYDREEAALGLACVAVPIVRGERVLGAVSVSGPASDELDGVTPWLRRAAAAVAAHAR